MFRTRDILAVLAAVLLTRMAWNDNLESLHATIHLAWYTPFANQRLSILFGQRLVYGAAPMDVDGDGTYEAFALVTTVSLAEQSVNKSPADGAAPKRNLASTDDEKWVVQILDLKPLHSRQRRSTTSASSSSSSASSFVGPTQLGLPFRPEPLFTSETLQFPSTSNADVGTAVNTKVIPLQLVTGHVLFVNPHYQAQAANNQGGKTSDEAENSATEDRTRHFFCGTDWHDASSRCGKHCPGGSPTECDTGERCFADTPCDIVAIQASAAESNKKEQQVMFQLTPGGGIPSIMTLWSDGSVSVHSVTGDSISSDTTTTTNHGKTTNKYKLPPLELRLLWHTSALKTAADNNYNSDKSNSSNTTASTIEPKSWWTSRIAYFDATTSSTPSGMVVVSGTIIGSKGGHNIHGLINFMTALDAKTGKILWQDDSQLTHMSSTTAAEKAEVDVPLPMDLAHRRISSSARRRSNIPLITTLRASLLSGSHNDLGQQHAVEHGIGLPNCLALYRRSLLSMNPFSRLEDQTLPHQSWGPEDGYLKAVHLDLQRRHQKEHHKHVPKVGGRSKVLATQGDNRKTRTGASVGKTKDKRWSLPTRRKHPSHHHRRHHHRNLLLGRPNVLVQHLNHGLQLRSLKNGRALCHLSLMDHVLYADLDQDGILDQVRVLTEDKQTMLNPYLNKQYKDTWNKEMWERITGDLSPVSDEPNDIDQDQQQQRGSLTTHLCHVMTLSGMPAKEEVFNAPLCGITPSHERIGDNPNAKVSGAPPLIVESLENGYNSYDVVIALNNGLVHRFRSSSPGAGTRQWQFQGHHHHSSELDVPTWSQDTQSNVLLARVDTAKTNSAPWNRPILLVGDNAMSILSARQGSLLASASFPQTLQARPILADVTGDGTNDVIIVTNDAIWGYQVIVQPGAPVIFRLLVGLLLLGISLALLRNRFGQRSDKRSTDE